jgi:ribosomal protein S18 acetylase RimI-like enzyme
MAEFITIRKITVDEREVLLDISRKTFLDAFAHVNNPEDIDAYASMAFSINRITDELTHPDSQFHFALIADEIVGYIKLNYSTAQTELQDSQSLEIERIYVVTEHQRKQIGNQMLDFAINKAITEGLKYIWLGVWEHNTQAIRFYERNGFKQFSSHKFMLGQDEQTDLLLRKDI